jgi:WD40 repeat protein
MTQTHTLSPPNRSIFALLSPDLGHLQKRIQHIFDGYQQEIYHLDFSSDSCLIVSGTRIWDMQTGDASILNILDPDRLKLRCGCYVCGRRLTRME